jgi:hypothetical protein
VQDINTVLGTTVPMPDLASVLAGDPLSTTALAAYCSLPANSQKTYCMCINKKYTSVTPLTCTTLLY